MTEPRPFEVKDCALITIAIGHPAQNLRELREQLETVPPNSVWHHFFETLLRPMFDDPEYCNDFAVWAHDALHDDVLAERLGMVDPLAFTDVERLRQQLVDLVEDRLAEQSIVTNAARGHEFQFLRSQVVVFSTELKADSPVELGGLIPGFTRSSVFFHFVEARRRTDDGADDLTVWLRDRNHDTEGLRRRLAAIDIHHASLTEIHGWLVRAFEGVSRGPEEVRP